MRTLAIDPGTRRIGLAVSDDAGKLATPLEVLDVTSAADIGARIARVVQNEDIGRLVVGLPLNMDGTVGPSARDAVALGRELSRVCGVPAIFVDERLSSFQAEQTIRARRRAGEKITRRGKKSRLDAVAAAAFLQEFLDGKLAPVDPDSLD
ncbi:MAG: Holliday junction resolvase RuvX [Tepidisphaeraceae bacterium]